VYGASSDDRLLTEESYLNPVSLYAKSKVASEKVIHTLASEDLAPVILRFGTIFGLSGRIRFDLVINLLVGMAHVDKKITVMGGDQWRPFVHVEDAATAILKCVEAPIEKVAGQTFNVGGDKLNYRIADIGNMIHKEFPDAQLIVKDNDTDKRNYRVSFKHIRETLEFEPKWMVQDGIKQIRDAFQSGKIKDYQNPEYNNFKFLTDETNSRLISSFREWVDQFLEDTTSVTANGNGNGNHTLSSNGHPANGKEHGKEHKESGTPSKEKEPGTGKHING
jgi:dTDP-D-glucose 4,6-dehydratase